MQQLAERTEPQGVEASRDVARARVEAFRRRDRLRQSRLAATLAVLTVLVGFTIAWLTEPTTLAADAFGELVAGELEVRDELTGDWKPVEVGAQVRFGVAMRTPVDAVAELVVRQGTITLGPTTRASTLPGTVELDQGRVLFEVSAFYLALSPNLVARGDGTWRLDADINPRVAVYEGSASATAGLARGQSRPEARSLVGWQQVELVAGAVGEPRPLSYVLDDPWDVEHAAVPIAVDDAVARTAAGIARTYGDDPRGQDFYEAFTVVDDGLELALGRFDVLAGEGFGPPADVLTAVLASRLIAERAAIDFPRAVTEVDDLRAAGATWGVVLARRDLGVDDWLRTVDLSLREIEELGEDAPPPAPPPSPVTPQPSPSPSPSPTSSPTPLPTPTPTPTPTPEPSPSEDPCDDPGNNSQQCVGQTVDEILDLIDDLIPPSPLGDPLGLGGMGPGEGDDAAEDGILDDVVDVLGLVLLGAGWPRFLG